MLLTVLHLGGLHLDHDDGDGDPVYNKAAARTFDALIEAIGDIRQLYDPQECSNCFKAVGYTSD